MFGVLLLACAAGAACGLARLEVWAIIPTSAFFLLIVVALGSHLGLPWDRIAIIVFSVLMLLQVSYLIGTVLFEPSNASPVSDQNRELLRTVRTAIAQDLRAYFQPLDDMPPQLRNKLAQLEGR
jgi:hypothetical protein